MAAKKLTFEESMARLEEIVSALEQNDAPLDQTVAMFEEGLKLVKSCDASLKQFERCFSSSSPRSLIAVPN